MAAALKTITIISAGCFLLGFGIGLIGFQTGLPWAATRGMDAMLATAWAFAVLKGRK
jgi:hypothetical protein